VTQALCDRLDGCAVVEPTGLRSGQIPDVVVFVRSAAAPMSDCDAVLFARAIGRTDAVVGAVTKIDVHRTWRAVLDRNRTSLPSPGRCRAWVGVAADPQIGPPVVTPLVEAVRAELDSEDRRRRNALRTREWQMQQRIAERQEQAARRMVQQARAARRDATRLDVQQARRYLAGEARTRSEALRAEAHREAAVASRRLLNSFDGRLCSRAQQLADDFDTVVAQRVAQISQRAGMAVPTLPPSPPVRDHLPAPRRAALEDRLAVVFGTGFGLGAALTFGRFVAELAPATAPALPVVCGAAGIVLAGWVVRTRQLLTARSMTGSWAAEVAAGLRTVLDERVLAAESALLAVHIGGVGDAAPVLSAREDPTVGDWIGELARVRAELRDNPD
jgi:hypothetical protein